VILDKQSIKKEQIERERERERERGFSDSSLRRETTGTAAAVGHIFCSVFFFLLSGGMQSAVLLGNAFANNYNPCTRRSRTKLVSKKQKQNSKQHTIITEEIYLF
jgi:hypothetical protein